MRQLKIKGKLSFFLSIIFLVLITLPVLAQSGGDYDLTWNTLDSGGYTFSTNGVYSLGGTIGQMDAGIMSGGVYTLSGGFWAGSEEPGSVFDLFLPLILK